MSGHVAEQEQELQVLSAIYADDCHVDSASRTVQVTAQGTDSEETSRCQVVAAAIMDVYPPAIELDAPHWSEDAIASACVTLERMYSPGQVVLYNWVEWLREAEESRRHTALSAHGADAGPAFCSASHSTGTEGDDEWMAAEECQGTSSSVHQPRGQTPSVPLDATLLEAVRARIVSGPPVTEKKSTFQAHVAPVASAAEAHAVVQVLLESNKIRNATHNIMAYRVHCAERGTYQQDCDDDGETAAGGRLLHLLQVADARDVVVVVSRWFGGVLLGPSRFSLINNTARQLLEAQGHISPRSRNKKKS